MSKQVRWLIFVFIFIGGLLLGFLGSILIPRIGLVALYERQGGWTLLGYVAVGLLLLAVPIGYTVWLIAGAVRFARPREDTTEETPLQYLRQGERADVERVLVSIGGGPHAQFGLDLAARFARVGGGSVTILRVFPPNESVDSESESETLNQMVEELIGSDVPIDVQIRRHPSVVEAIVDETEASDYDLLIVGASDERTVSNLLFGTIPDAVAERTPCPVLIVRAPDALE